MRTEEEIRERLKLHEADLRQSIKQVEFAVKSRNWNEVLSYTVFIQRVIVSISELKGVLKDN